MFNFLSELFNPKNMKKGGRNVITPEQKLNRPTPPKRIIPPTRTIHTVDDNSNDLLNTIIAAEVIESLLDTSSCDSSYDNSYDSSSSDSSCDFGGGDFGGGGSSGDW